MPELETAVAAAPTATLEKEPIGLLVMAYGTASGPDDIERYYTDIRRGRPPSPEALQELTDRYAAIGNTFPLARITTDQGRALEAELNRDAPGRFRLYLGMKHSPPFIADAVGQMVAEGIREAVGLVLAPHYSKMSIGGYMERVVDALPDRDGPRFRFVEHWHDHPRFLDVLEGRVRDARDRLTEEERAGDLTIFTAHSLPERIVAEGDPYPAQLQETADLMAHRLGLERYRIGWQSEGRTSEPWLGPPLEEIVRKAAADGHAAIVVCPCGFVSDHLEILYDIDIEAQGVAREAGIRLIRTASMNADPAFIEALAQVVRDRLAREG